MATSKKPTTKRKVGRPTGYDLDLCVEVCEKVSEGKNIKTVLKSSTRYPSFPTWCRWKRENLELFNLYIGAIQDKSESVMYDIDQIEKDIRNKNLDWNQARLLLDTAKWKAAKFYPKMFGTNAAIDITTKGKEITQQVTVFKLPDNGRSKEEPTEDQKGD